MSKFEKCKKCWREFMGWMCLNCEGNKKPVKEVKQKLVKVIKSKPEVKSLNQKKPKIKTSSKEEFNGYTLYTKSYLHNVEGMSNKSIENKVWLIKVWDKYIFENDIIIDWMIQNKLI